MITQQTQAAAVANTLIAQLAQAASLQAQIDATVTEWTTLSVANMINAFPTAVFLTTGALGTADGSPNVAHPIDTRTADGALITRAISANDIAGIVTGLNGISAAIKGQAVSANGALASLIAKVL
jgi:hypothetical protein